MKGKLEPTFNVECCMCARYLINNIAGVGAVPYEGGAMLVTPRAWG
jgi:hypothetical protein